MRRLVNPQVYDDAVKVYMAETAKVPPPFSGTREKKERPTCPCGCTDPWRHADGVGGAEGAPYFPRYGRNNGSLDL